jgi:hypothetical protein
VPRHLQRSDIFRLHAYAMGSAGAMNVTGK